MTDDQPPHMHADGQPAHRHPGGDGMHWHQRAVLPPPDEDEVVDHLHPLHGWHEHKGGAVPHAHEEHR